MIYTRRQMSGKAREDFLDEDNEIPGQRFVLLSFLSPEKILARKDLYFFEQFLKNYEITWKTKNLEKFLAKQVVDFNAKVDAEANRLEAAEQSQASELIRASRIPVDTVLGAYQDFIKENAKEITQVTIKEQFDDFMYASEKKLEESFHKQNSFQTSTRGLKVRGSYSTAEEASARAKKLQRNDDVHNIFVAEVGKWLAWDPSPNNIAEQEYQNDQLNELMHSYKENEQQREEFFKQNPDARKAATGGPKRIIGAVEASEASDAVPSGTAVPSGAVGQLDSMINSPDLALQRKIDAAAAATAAAAVAEKK